MRAVADANDVEARDALAWAATLAGIAFGNAGVHLPHAMSYAVAGLAHDRDYHCPGYPARRAARAPRRRRSSSTRRASSGRRRRPRPSAISRPPRALGADVRAAPPTTDAGALLADTLVALMQMAQAPNGLGGVGYGEDDVDALARGAIVQKRLVDNAPRAVDERGAARRSSAVR